jgi:alpha-L-fucosidase
MHMDRRNAIRLLAAAAATAPVLYPSVARASYEFTEPPYPTGDAWTALQHETPEWYRDAKFGIYYHWGIYSVPAFATEWYPHWMYRPGRPEYEHHIKTYGPLDKFGYKDFLPQFKAEKWDPDAWVSLFTEAGAKYMGPVAEHADGFSMWDSKVNRWNAAKMGPKRDLVGDMEKAVRRKNMKFVTTFHHQWLWGWYQSSQKNADIYQPENADLYWPTPFVDDGNGPNSTAGGFDYAHPSPAPSGRFCESWRDKVVEVVDRYNPDLIYFDTRTFIIPQMYRQQMASHYYKRAAEQKREVVMTFKFHDFSSSSGVADFEAGQLSKIADSPWQTDDLMDWTGSWSYSQTPDFKSAPWLIHQLIDIVSKNGNLLPDVGPRPDGTISEPMQERLRTIGAWLRINGEAIYGSRPWTTFGEGPTMVREGAYIAKHIPDFTPQDIRFTTRAGKLYIIVLGWPGGQLRVKSINKGTKLPTDSIREITMLGTSARIKWKLDDQGLLIHLPDHKPCDHAFTFRVS